MPAGRPPKFESREQLQSLIDAYFDSCWETYKDNKRVQIRPYTITGLANALDTTRETLLDYEDKEEFSDTIKKAKCKVEQYVEEYLFVGRNTAGAIFNLKNNYSRWKDKVEQELTNPDNSLKTIIINKYGDKLSTETTGSMGDMEQSTD